MTSWYMPIRQFPVLHAPIKRPQILGGWDSGVVPRCRAARPQCASLNARLARDSRPIVAATLRLTHYSVLYSYTVSIKERVFAEKLVQPEYAPGYSRTLADPDETGPDAAPGCNEWKPPRMRLCGSCFSTTVEAAREGQETIAMSVFSTLHAARLDLRMGRTLREAAGFKVSDHDGDLGTLGGLGEQGKVLEERVG